MRAQIIFDELDFAVKCGKWAKKSGPLKALMSAKTANFLKPLKIKLPKI